MIAAGYQPGYTQLESKGIVLSISIPVITLASQIEPRALMAWDSRLLSESQHLTLIIAGFHDVYPVLHNDGFLVPRLKELGIKDLQFRVGLTPTYKADKDTLREILCRPEPVKVEEDDPQLVEDLRLAESLQCEEYSQLDFLDAQATRRGQTNNNRSSSFPHASNVTVLDRPVPLEPFNGDTSLPNLWDAPNSDTPQPQPEVEPEDTPKPKFHFSLSETLESLFQERFLQLVQLRLRYNIGWAAAELLIDHSERAQQRPEIVYFDIIYVSSLLMC